MQMAQQYPQIYDLPELNKQMLEVLGVKNIAKLIPSTDQVTPKDPVTENMDVINGKPVKAFIYQDHQAHIQVHMAAMQDPKIMQIVGQNPMAQTIQAAAMAHINEHVAFEYRKQLEEQLGVPLPAPEEVLPEDVEFEISKLMAQAASKLLTKDQAEVQQQQIEQQQQDPIIQMQQQELALKAQDLQIKQQKTQADIEIEHMRVNIEKMRVESQERIAGATLGAQAVKSEKDSEIKQFTEGTRLGIQAVKDSADRDLRKEQAQLQHQAQMEQVKVQQRNQQPKE
jgi:hypothetical protein